ncbi:CBS/transporter associated domain-containing protein [Cystobacter fuscus DSM 2262]|uniref:CBS/transporter associated domain-containing protein n=1 Tax=Cystobacter fuscus (strain ATCC 25194 / DSM 2262 / NBRC 100088 / M29) TaxID=1242864 RepID=S9QIF7_CYSF2|nr:CBS/transporter associated domain-containing protein [Cystobacter fuscus DSM 2262]
MNVLRFIISLLWSNGGADASEMRHSRERSRFARDDRAKGIRFQLVRRRGHRSGLTPRITRCTRSRSRLQASGCA